MAKKTYYGPQTEQALHNFPFPYRPVYLELVYAIAEVKKAAARANVSAGNLEQDISDRIEKACDEICSGKFDDQFPTVGLQGGAGTSIHMNVNEVIAARAEELLHQDHISKSVHPNDHVNASQSTNDVNPSALRIACIRLSMELLVEVKQLADTFRKRAEEHVATPKLARTHIQDAIPTTIGAECASYEAMVVRDARRIEEAVSYLYELNLGGTAIGNSINASESYRKAVYRELENVVGLPVRPAQNLMALTSNSGDVCQLSAAVTILATTLSKIALDLRFMASGPNGGIAEIQLEQLQPGSSIMPGKVNPVMPEAVNQLFYFTNGKNVTIHQAAEAGHMELAVMFPIIADGILTVLKINTAVVRQFREKCIQTFTVDKDRCQKLLEGSTAYATLLTPVLGYDVVSKVVQESVSTGQSIRSLIIEKGLMSEPEFDAATRI
ncbi:MAG: lyase family protein [Patescibacteria group bacterium]